MNESYQVRTRKSIKWKFYRFIWIQFGAISRFAATKICAMSRKADEMDYPSSK